MRLQWRRRWWWWRWLRLRRLLVDPKATVLRCPAGTVDSHLRNLNATNNSKGAIAMLVMCKRIVLLIAAGLLSAGALAQAGTKIPIHLVNGKISINGQQQVGTYSVTKTDFRFLYFYVPSQGVLIISNQQFPDAIKAGSFEGRRLTLELPGMEFKL